MLSTISRLVAVMEHRREHHTLGKNIPILVNILKNGCSISENFMFRDVHILIIVIYCKYKLIKYIRIIMLAAEPCAFFSLDLHVVLRSHWALCL